MNRNYFINIHTHKYCAFYPGINILNTYTNNVKSSLSIPNVHLSLGIHPFFIEIEKIEQELSIINKNIPENKIIAIGEIGMDRFSNIEINIQRYCFIEQVKIAEKYSKPIIIHCVRCFSELIEIKKKMKTNIPWIIHAFVANEIITKELIKHGFYFSLGAYIIPLLDANKCVKKNINNREIKIYNNIKILPLHRLFLETDDDDVCISEVYNAFASIKKMNLCQLITIVMNNFLNCFNIDD